MAVAVVSGAMAVTPPAHADSAANGSAADPPGLISGSGVQLSVNLTVNLCGNTVNVVGALNPAAGNTCANEGEAAATGAQGLSSGGGATANGVTKDSPGVVSGNGVQLPVHLPVNAGGNSVNVVGIANPAFGNESVNVFGEGHAQPAEPAPQPPVRHNPPSDPQQPVPKTVPVPRAPPSRPRPRREGGGARAPGRGARGRVLAGPPRSRRHPARPRRRYGHGARRSLPCTGGSARARSAERFLREEGPHAPVGRGHAAVLGRRVVSAAEIPL
ncbi:chaplin [Streptomyces sp. NBC_01235]|uniref:chaplin n=1 Tax=Streptomyces sp. NBC_01235 TaxID=2903788 RepID=UPI002E149807